MEVLDVDQRDADLNTLLHLAARAGQAATVYGLVQEEGMDVNSLNLHRETPLHSAAAGKDKEVGIKIIQFLLEHGANPYAKDKDNDTFLHIYVEQEETPTPAQFHVLVEYLVKKNLADLVSYPGGLNQATPLQVAVDNLEPKNETLDLLKRHNLNVNLPDSDGDGLLAYAVYGMRSTAFISYIINLLGADRNHLNGNGAGILQIAAYCGNLATLKYLIRSMPNREQRQPYLWNALLHLSVDPDSHQIEVIDKCRYLIAIGANKDSKTAKFKQTALHLAAIGSGVEVIIWLIQNGADPYLKDDYDYTFLHHYLWREESPTPSQFHSLTEYLIGKGLYKLFNMQGGEDRETPVHLALLKLEVEERTLTLLSSNKVNFKVINRMGDTTLIYAVQGKRSLKLLSILMEEFQVKWRGQNRRKNSLLHFAAEQSNYESLKFFLDMGSLDVNGIDVDGDTPLSCALHQEDKGEVLKKCKLLIETGADISIANKEGSTPLEIMRREYNGTDREELEKLLSISPSWPNENDNPIATKAKRNATTHLQPRNK